MLFRHSLLRIGQPTLNQTGAGSKRLASSLCKPISASVLNPPDSELTKLSNGVRVASENHGGSLTTVGVWMDIGSRHERESQSGATHILKNLFFEGTENKSKAELHRELNKITKYVDAYNGIEQSALFATCLPEDVDAMMGLLSEMLLKPNFGEDTVSAARERALDKLEQIKYDTAEIVFNHAHQQAYQRTPLSMPQYGRRRNVRSITSDALSLFHSSYYKGHRFVVAGVGDIEHDHLVDLTAKYFGGMDNVVAEATVPQTVCRFVGGEIDHREDSWPYCYVLATVEGAGWDDVRDCLHLQVASKMMGEWSSWREPFESSPYRLPKMTGWHNKIIAYNSVYVPYYQTGLWGTYFVCKKTRDLAQEVMKHVISEWRYLATQADDIDVNCGKHYLLNELHSGDTVREIADSLGRDVLRYGQRLLTPSLVDQVQQINANSLKDISERYIYDGELSVASFGHTADLTFWRYPWWYMYTYYLGK
jgi:processing peptidase subunit beta